MLSTECQQHLLCHTEESCNIHAHLTWKHKQISSTSRSKRLEKLIFCFVFFLLLTSGKAVTILLQPAMPKPTPCVSRICAVAHWFFCELIWLNNRGSHQNCSSSLSKGSFPTDPSGITHATFGWYCRILHHPARLYLSERLRRFRCSLPQLSPHRQNKGWMNKNQYRYYTYGYIYTPVYML